MAVKMIKVMRCGDYSATWKAIRLTSMENLRIARNVGTSNSIKHSYF